jgi:hypothetical protein
MIFTVVLIWKKKCLKKLSDVHETTPRSYINDMQVKMSLCLSFRIKRCKLKSCILIPSSSPFYPETSLTFINNEMNWRTKKKKNILGDILTQTDLVYNTDMTWTIK